MMTLEEAEKLCAELSERIRLARCASFHLKPALKDGDETKALPLAEATPVVIMQSELFCFLRMMKDRNSQYVIAYHEVGREKRIDGARLIEARDLQEPYIVLVMPNFP